MQTAANVKEVLFNFAAYRQDSTTTAAATACMTSQRTSAAVVIGEPSPVSRQTTAPIALKNRVRPP